MKARDMIVILLILNTPLLSLMLQ